jgi:Domain of unknown function (DUF5655)
VTAGSVGRMYRSRWTCPACEREFARAHRYVNGSGHRVWHVLRLTAVEEVDDEVRSWLTEAYSTAFRYSA